MKNIQYFNTFVRNPVDNQVCIENDVAVSAAFGCKMAALRMIGVVVPKSFNKV